MNRIDVFTEDHKVAVYSRVSTLLAEQDMSIENQDELLQSLIDGTPSWNYIASYSDRASGGNAKHRDGLLTMLEDAKQGKFDLIITKEISRIFRNILELLTYINELKKYNVECYFYTDNIYTGDSDSMLRLQLMGALYENEILNTSRRVNAIHQKNFKEGKVYGTGIYGFHLKDGILTINEDEAKIVRKVYDLFLQGKGYRAIKTQLEEENILSPTNTKTWNTNTIRRILTNEKYKGDLKQGKSFTVSHLTHERKNNNGEKDFVYIENHHEPIISKDTWNKTQDEILKRANFYKHKVNNRSGKYSAKFPYSSKLICGKCGTTLKRKIYNKRKDGTHTHCWACGNRADNGTKACDFKPIPEYLLDEMMKEIISTMIKDKDMIMKALEIALNEAIKEDDYKKEILKYQTEINKLKNKQEILLDNLLDNTITKEMYKKKNEEVQKDLDVKQELLESYINKDLDKNSKIDRVQHLYKIFQQDINLEDEESLNNITREILNQMVIKDRSHYIICLSTDTRIEVKYNKDNIPPFVMSGMHGKTQRVVDIINVFTRFYDFSDIFANRTRTFKERYGKIQVDVYLAM